MLSCRALSLRSGTNSLGCSYSASITAFLEFGWGYRRVSISGKFNKAEYRDMLWIYIKPTRPQVGYRFFHVKASEAGWVSLQSGDHRKQRTLEEFRKLVTRLQAWFHYLSKFRAWIGTQLLKNPINFIRYWDNYILNETHPAWSRVIYLLLGELIFVTAEFLMKSIRPDAGWYFYYLKLQSTL